MYVPKWYKMENVKTIEVEDVGTLRIPKEWVYNKDGDFIYFTKQTTAGVSKDFNPKFYSQKNDIVVLLAGSVVTKLEKEGIIIPMYYAVVRVREGFDADFIYQLLKSDIFPKELHKLQEGTTLKVIKTTHLKQISLPLPDYETQMKYGNLFRLMDKRINKLYELAINSSYDYVIMTGCGEEQAMWESIKQKLIKR